MFRCSSLILPPPTPPFTFARAVSIGAGRHEYLVHVAWISATKKKKMKSFHVECTKRAVILQRGRCAGAGSQSGKKQHTLCRIFAIYSSNKPSRWEHYTQSQPSNRETLYATRMCGLFVANHVTASNWRFFN